MNLTPKLFVLAVVLTAWTAIIGIQSVKLYNLAATIALESQCTTSQQPQRPLGSLSV